MLFVGAREQFVECLSNSAISKNICLDVFGKFSVVGIKEPTFCYVTMKCLKIVLNLMLVKYVWTKDFCANKNYYHDNGFCNNEFISTVSESTQGPSRGNWNVKCLSKNNTYVSNI